MVTLAAIFGASVLLGVGFLLLRGAEIRAERRFALAGVRCAADGWVENRARSTRARFRVLEHRAAAWLRALPHRAADAAAFVLRLVATRALRWLRWLHERRARGHVAAAEATKGSVSFFVSALGDAKSTTRQGTSARGSF
jgi:hypothetical protein